MCLGQGLLPWYHVAFVFLPSPISDQHAVPSRRAHTAGKVLHGQFQLALQKSLYPSLCLQARAHTVEAGEVQ
jgi:hypothetical protein